MAITDRRNAWIHAIREGDVLRMPSRRGSAAECKLHCCDVVGVVS